MVWYRRWSLQASRWQRMHIRRCRHCGACFSRSKFRSVDRFRTNARPHIKNLSILLLSSALSPVDLQPHWAGCHDSTRVRSYALAARLF